MSETKELTYSEVSEHSSKKDLFLVVHDKVYNATSFVDEHPGGEEVLMDVGGQDATEAFEDVGHSDEAREILDGLLVGALKRAPMPFTQPPLPLYSFTRQLHTPTTTSTSTSPHFTQRICVQELTYYTHQPGDPAPKSEPPKPSTSTPTPDSTGLGVGLYALVLLGGALAFGAYKYLQMQSSEQK